MKIIRWGWFALSALISAMALGDQMWIPATLFAISSALCLPRLLHSHLGGRLRPVLVMLLAIAGFLAIGATASRMPKHKAEEIGRRTDEQTNTATGSVVDDWQAEEKRKAKREAEKSERDSISGTKCLDGWGGSNRSLRDQVKSNLRDPDSFKIYSTSIAPRTPQGFNPIAMEYGARNGFGGMNRLVAYGLVDPETCKTVVVSSGE